MSERPAGPTTIAGALPEVVAEVVSPVAPGTAPSGGAPVQIDEVAPDLRPRAAVPLVVGGCALAVLVVVGTAVGRDASWLVQGDLRLHLVAVGHRGPADVGLAGAITWLGATAVALPAVAVIGALAVRRPATWSARAGAGALLAAVASTGVYAGLVLNSLMDRARPPVGDWLGAAGGPAFPSGHTTMGTLFALCCAWALTPHLRSRGGRVALWAGAALVAGAVGWSRVWLGVHWPSDVVGGWAFGAAWGALCVAGVAAWRRRSSRRPVSAAPTPPEPPAGGRGRPAGARLRRRRA